MKITIKKKLFWAIILILIAAFVFLVKSTYAEESYVEETPACVEVNAPDPVEFEANIAKIGTVNATYRWFEESEGHWVLKIDIDPIGGENHRNWKSSYPNLWGLAFKKPVDLPQTVDEVDCPEPPVDEEEESTPSATIVPTNTTSGGGISMPSAPSCDAEKPGDVANINVVQGAVDTSVLVQWSIPVRADKAHILYWETGHSNSEHGFAHALLNTPNDGNEEIHLLKSKTKYSFAVAGVNGCKVGDFSRSFDQLP